MINFSTRIWRLSSERWSQIPIGTENSKTNQHNILWLWLWYVGLWFLIVRLVHDILYVYFYVNTSITLWHAPLTHLQSWIHIQREALSLRLKYASVMQFRIQDILHSDNIQVAGRWTPETRNEMEQDEKKTERSLHREYRHLSRPEKQLTDKSRGW